VPNTIQEHRLTVLEEYVHDLFEECREAIEESKNFIAQSKKAKEKSRELVAAARCLRTH